MSDSPKRDMKHLVENLEISKESQLDKATELDKQLMSTYKFNPKSPSTETLLQQFPSFLNLRGHDTPEAEEFFLSLNSKKTKGGFYLKLFKFTFMLGIIFVFLVVELVCGIIGNSLALISDSFHMTSDAISYLIGLSSVLLSLRKKTTVFSYGWARAEVMGAMINSVFLLSVVYFIYIEAINRFIKLETITNPWLLLIVGCVGLVIDTCGLIIMSISETEESPIDIQIHPECCFLIYQYEEWLRKKDKLVEEEEEEKKCTGNWFGKMSANTAAVFFHILGDLLGSLGVVISVLLYLLFPMTQDGDVCTKNCWLLYIDPSLSAIIATLILITTVPLFISNIQILMQSAPRGINLDQLKKDLEEEFKNDIDEIHEFHMWKLAGEKYICSMHIQTETPERFLEVQNKIKVYLHYKGIHNTTIQPEFKVFNRDEFSKLMEYCYIFDKIVEERDRKMGREPDPSKGKIVPLNQLAIPEEVELGDIKPGQLPQEVKLRGEGMPPAEVPKKEEIAGNVDVELVEKNKMEEEKVGDPLDLTSLEKKLVGKVDYSSDDEEPMAKYQPEDGEQLKNLIEDAVQKKKKKKKKKRKKKDFVDLVPEGRPFKVEYKGVPVTIYLQDDVMYIPNEVKVKYSLIEDFRRVSRTNGALYVMELTVGDPVRIVVGEEKLNEFEQAMMALMDEGETSSSDED